MKPWKHLSLTVRLITILFASMFFYDIAQGQNPSPDLSQLLKFEHEDQCGNPLYESMLWFGIKGRAVEVPDGSTIVILLDNNIRKRVHLVAIEAPNRKTEAGKAAHKMLIQFALGKTVSVLVNPSNAKAKELTGVVDVVGMTLNQKMIELGLVRYKTPEAYSMSGYTSCIYRIIETEAQKAKRGLWRQAEISQPAERKP